MLTSLSCLHFSHKKFVKQIQSAQNNTFVMLYTESSLCIYQRTHLVHITEEGEHIFTICSQNIEEFLMVGEGQLVVPSASHKQMRLVDLETRSIKYFPLQPLKENQQCTQMLFFKESGMLCLQYQTRGLDKNIQEIILQYWDCSAVKILFESTVNSLQAELVDFSFRRELKVHFKCKKGNNHSLILFNLTKYNKLLHDVLFIDGKPSFRIRKIATPQQLRLREYLWEVGPNEILFVPSYIRQKLFICTINTETNRVRPLKWQPTKNNKSITSFLPLENAFVLRMARHEFLKSSRFPITIQSTFVVNFITEKLEFTEQRVNNFQRESFQESSSNNTNEMLQVTEETLSNSGRKAKKLVYLPEKQIALHLMLQLNEDFDDDLLLDVIDLFDQE